jgi:putative methionine-R-sulfoxide reductase with GAF domain
VTDQKNKPVLDEQAFERLLQAAYVLQEHNRKMRVLEKNLESQSEQLREQELAHQAARLRSQPKSEESSRSRGDYTLTLAEIVEAQHQIQMRHLELDKAMAVVAERVARITGASGAGIGILDGSTVRYRAGAGSPALPVGSEVPLAEAICQANVRTGQVIRTEDVDTEFLFDPEPCRQRGILSLVAVPIYHDGNIVGALELYFDKLQGYAEQDIHTCQLMAGLVTEAIGRDADSTLKRSMAAERSTMLATIERLQPTLAALAQDRSAATASTSVGASVAPPKSPCWKCGNNIVATEQFCGKCGAPRAGDAEPADYQSKVASAWHKQQTSHEPFPAAPSNGTSPPGQTMQSKAVHAPGHEPGRAQDKLFSEHMSLPEGEESKPWSAVSFSANGGAMMASASSASQLEGDDIDGASTALTKPQRKDVVWTSAAKARDFLESVTGTRTPGALVRFWRSRRGDFYLAVALILVLVVIRWGIWSNHSVGAVGRGTAVSAGANHRRPAPDADLSMFDKLLIGLGLAEAPETPEQKSGNPDVQVWVDLQTALYYCPGSDLYGKTPKGKLTSQRDAQLDQFEPAFRKACE